MADEKNTELDELAFEIYSKRVATHASVKASEAEAVDAYRKAEAFVAVKKKVRAGGVKPLTTTEAQGADCRAPKLRDTHPINLVSREVGNLPRVEQIKKWLDQNPTPETNPEELIHRLNRAFNDLGWDMPTINVARQIFPAYAKN